MQALKFIARNELCDNMVYNIVTENLTPTDLIRMIEAHVGRLEIQYTDAQIMNLLSYEVSNRRFSERGFSFSGSIEKDIFETISLLRAHGGSNG